MFDQTKIKAQGGNTMPEGKKVKIKKFIIFFNKRRTKVNKHKLNYFEIIAFINNLEKKYPGRKYYPYPSSNKNKKNKETHLLLRLEKKYPENWSYGSKEVQGG